MRRIAAGCGTKAGRGLRATAGSIVAATAVVGAVITAPSSSAAPLCSASGASPVLVAQAPGAALEAVTVDRSGRLYATDLLSGRILRFDGPGSPASVVATVPGGGAGGLAWAPDGDLLVGYGAQTAATGDAMRAAGIVKVNVATGAVVPFATGLSAANGLAVGPDGTVYATNDLGSLIGRVSPDGTVQADWATLPSANGAAVDADGRYLYVSRSFVDPGVSRIPVSNPSAPESLVTFGGVDVLAIPDGLTLDGRGRPLVPAAGTGQFLRVDGPNAVCAVANGPLLSSAVAYGAGPTGFSAGRLFRVGFDGAVFEV
ncbi:SMP-30/gluconolactonase/LRE family protein [Rhodococcus gannanensis]|uniref:SMP-30/gluconolactonase/LRE family protein n=1 Tax=Rhodococcus gannanensis TaxID=1960308 RepID=A0ABW4P0C5_9NOCA